MNRADAFLAEAFDVARRSVGRRGDERCILAFLSGYLASDFPRLSTMIDGTLDEKRSAPWPFPHGDDEGGS